jgi:hypothetical protein
MPCIAFLRALWFEFGRFPEKNQKRVLRLVSMPALNYSWYGPINSIEMKMHTNKIRNCRKYERNSHPSP